MALEAGETYKKDNIGHNIIKILKKFSGPWV